MCCINIRNFVDQFYQFMDGVASQHHLDIDEVLRKVSDRTSLHSGSNVERAEPEQSLDGLLSAHVAGEIATKLKSMSNLSQIAQVVINLEHFVTACEELEGVLAGLR